MRADERLDGSHVESAERNARKAGLAIEVGERFTQRVTWADIVAVVPSFKLPTSRHRCCCPASEHTSADARIWPETARAQICSAELSDVHVESLSALIRGALCRATRTESCRFGCRWLWCSTAC